MKIIASSTRFIRPYIAVFPTPLSIGKLNKLTAMASYIPNKTVDQEYHTTLVFDTLDQKFQDVKKSVMPALVHLATITKIDIFMNVDHDSLNLVALLECDSLQERFAYFHATDGTGQNLNHSFPDYKPHITLSANPHKEDKKVEDFQHGLELLEFARDDLNKVINESEEPIKIYLTREKLAPLNDDYVNKRKN